MALDYFRIKKGLAIASSLSQQANILHGTINPSTIATDAKTGSLYLRDTGAGAKAYLKEDDGITTNWQRLLTTSSISASSEDAYQNDFIGKNSEGITIPDYLTNNIVIDGANLESSIGMIDSNIGANITPTNRTNNQLIAGAPIKTHINLLDSAIGGDISVVTRSSYQLSTSNDINKNINILNSVVGSDAQLSGGNYVSTGQSVNENFINLDTQVLVNKTELSNKASEIDAHINTSSIHRQINGDLTATNLWSGSKISQEIDIAEPVLYHNNLSNLQGGTTDEYYHLNSEQNTEVTGFFSTTDITGTQAETLTDSSIADDLHKHTHNNLSSIQGGITDEHYHLSNAQHSSLTDGVDATPLHIHDSRYYTETETDIKVSSAVAALVDGAPEVLDTLNELASALGDDENFSVTVTSQIAGKATLIHFHNTSAINAGTFDNARISSSNVTQHESDINHNNLSNLQGGTTDEYYHLTSDEESKLTSGGDADTYHSHGIYALKTDSITHLSGMIGTTSDAGDFSSIDDWSGSAGDYKAKITLESARTNAYDIHFKFYTLYSTTYTEITPMTVECSSITAYEVHMPTDGDLYTDAL